jgi:multicomponent Na+:H+ antiporter subunit A
MQDHPLYPFILIMVLLGAFTKSAQFPFHFWLPNAMSAPTPISAFLHAATMVKAGIYLLMRFHPLLGGTPAWMCTLVIVGWRHGGLERAAGLRAPGPEARAGLYHHHGPGHDDHVPGGQSATVLTAAATFLLVHALYKAALFLAAASSTMKPAPASWTGWAVWRAACR